MKRLIAPLAFTLFVVVAVAVAPGCEKAVETSIGAASGQQIDLNNKDGTISIKAGEGTINIDGKDGKGALTISGTGDNGEKVNAVFGTGGKWPDGLPLPALDGMTIQTGATADKNGKKSFFVTGTTTKSPKEVTEFYNVPMQKLVKNVNVNNLEVNGTLNSSVNGDGDGKKVAITAIAAGAGQPTNVMIAAEGF